MIEKMVMYIPDIKKHSVLIQKDNCEQYSSKNYTALEYCQGLRDFFAGLEAMGGTYEDWESLDTKEKFLIDAGAQ